VNLPTLETEPSSLAAALHPVAERIYALPNPYQDFDAAPLPELRPEGSTLPLPELERERRYFEMEDSGDMMGIRLNQNILAGLQVEFMGPAEDPRSSRKIVFMKTDPFHQRYLLTTAGATLRF